MLQQSKPRLNSSGALLLLHLETPTSPNGRSRSLAALYVLSCLFFFSFIWVELQHSNAAHFVAFKIQRNCRWLCVTRFCLKRPKPFSRRLCAFSPYCCRHVATSRF